MKTSGIMDLLDEECKLPKGSPDHFTDTVHSKHKGHFRLTVSVKNDLRELLTYIVICTVGIYLMYTCTYIHTSHVLYILLIPS